MEYYENGLALYKRDVRLAIIRGALKQIRLTYGEEMVEIMAEKLGVKGKNKLQEKAVSTVDIMAWKEGLPDLPDNQNLPAIVSILMAIQYDKETGYGSSWKGKGEYRGIMANIDRKYDRLDKMTQDEINGTRETLSKLEQGLKSGVLDPSVVGESKIDAIADLANYCLLYLTYVKEQYPEVFNVWLERNIPNYLADKLPLV